MTQRDHRSLTLTDKGTEAIHRPIAAAVYVLDEHTRAFSLQSLESGARAVLLVGEPVKP